MGANVTLYEDGKLRPHIEAGGKVTADAAKGSVSVSIGTDEYDVHVKADGELGHAEAKGQFRAGIIEKEDANGNKTTERGVGMEFGAEAYMNNLLIPVIGCGLSVPFHLPDWKIFRSRSKSAVPSSAHWEQLCS